jgi:hypothetical protein
MTEDPSARRVLNGTAAASLLVSGFLMLLGISAARAGEGTPDAAPTRAPAIEQLLDLTGVLTAAAVTAQQAVGELHAANPSFPDEVWASYAARVSDRQTLTALYTPIYAAHLSEDDVGGLVAFYRSPSGTHLREVLPQIGQESRAAAQRFAGEIALDIDGAPDDSGGFPPGPRANSHPPRASSDAFAASVQVLLREAGTLAEAKTAMTDMLERLRRGPAADTVPSSFWGKAQARLTDENALLELWTPAYMHHLTEAQVHELIDFYRSPLGRRYVQAMPAIRAESLQAATVLANEAARKAVREVLGPLPQWKLQHPSPATTPEPPGNRSEPPR